MTVTTSDSNFMSAETSRQDLVVVSQATKRYTSKRAEVLTVMENVDLTVSSNECVVIIGPSGCGKSTLLSCIAGLTELTEGSITIQGQTVTGPSEQSAVVFQHASLLPWKTVQENVAFGIGLRGAIPRERINELVQNALEKVGLKGFEDHYPHQLSGGMQQRANLARAFVVQAPLILMDEPFGALDALTKEMMQDELARLMMEINGATVFITHDIREAIYLADKVVVMSTRPGTIAKEIHVPFSKPRNRDITATHEFEALEHELRAMLHPEDETAHA